MSQELTYHETRFYPPDMVNAQNRGQLVTLNLMKSHSIC